jgi:hypothetical protein
VLGRLTEEVELVLKDPSTLTVTLSYDLYRNHYSGPVGREVKVIELEQDGAFPSRPLPYGRYALDVHTDGECLKIVFYPGWSWTS